MIRKLLTSILCLLLALALPLYSFAATEATLTVVPGDELAKQPLIKDVLDTFAIQLVGDAQASAGALRVLMGGESVIGLALRVSEDGLYAESSLLGDKALFFSWEGLGKLIQTVLEKNGVSIDQLGNALGQLTANIPVGITSLTGDKATDKDKLLEMLKEQFKDDPTIIELIDDIASRVVVTEGEFTSEAHDTATKKSELIITSADLVKIADSNRLRATMQKVIDQQYASLSDDEKAAKLDELIAQVKKVYSDMNISASITVLTDATSRLPVSMVYDITSDGTIETNKTENGVKTTENVPVKISAPTTYNRLTTESGVSYTADMTFELNGKTEAVMRGNLNRNADETSQGTLAMLAGSEQVTFTYSKVKTDDIKNREISVYLRSNATSIIEPAASDRPLLTFRLETKPADESVLAAVKSATPDSAVSPLNFSQEELNTFITDMSTRLTQLLYTVLGKLPPSVLESLGFLFQSK